MIRESTITKLYQQYLAEWGKLEANNLIKIYNIDGQTFKERQISEKAFRNNLLRALAADEDLNRRTFGRDLARAQGAYSNEQLHYFRYEVKDNLDKIDPIARKEIEAIMAMEQTTKSYWSFTDFKRNAQRIMKIYFSAGGNKYLTET